MKASTRRTILVTAIIVLALVAVILALSLSGPKEIPFQSYDPEAASFESLYKTGKIQAIAIQGT